METLFGMMINAAGKKIILPISIIKRSFKIVEKDITRDPSGESMVVVDEGVKVLLEMSEYLGIPPSPLSINERIVMLLEDSHRKICVVVDELIGECRAEVMPLPPFCGDGNHISGCALLNGSDLYLIVNYADLFKGILPEEYDEPPADDKPPAVMETGPVFVEDKYMTFRLADETYALHISFVKEIISVCEIITVPKASYVVEGVINRRGDILPVINLMKLFSSGGENHPASIIILEYNDLSFGILIDKVNEPVKLDEENIKPLPTAKAIHENSFVSRLGRYNDEVVLILELDKIIDAI
jgi:purine-binding chemotaxis protein CheW